MRPAEHAEELTEGLSGRSVAVDDRKKPSNNRVKKIAMILTNFKPTQ